MRAPLLFLGTVLSLQVPTLAQNNRHLFWPDDGAPPVRFFQRVSAATRVGGANTAEVECLSDLSASQFRGIGSFDATTCTLTGQIYIVQDSDQTTANPFKLVVRRPVAPDGLPDGSAAGAIAISGTLNTPIGTATGGVAWQLTSTWATPVTIPCETGYYVGVSLLPYLTAADGTLTWTASAFAAGATPPTTSAGDNPRLPTPKWHACRVDQPAGTATRTTSARTLAIQSLTDMPVMNVGNDDIINANYTSYGIGGLYPDIQNRADGLTVRIEDFANAGGLAAAILSFGYLPGGFSLPGYGGAIWVDPALLIVTVSGAIPATAPEVFEATMLAAGTIPLSAIGLTITFQGLTFGAAGGRFSNAQSVSF